MQEHFYSCMIDANKGRIYDNRYSAVIVLSSVASFIITFILPSSELVQKANNKTTKEIRLAKKIMEMLIISVQRFSEFSIQLLISINAIEIQSGRNDVKYKQLDTSLDIHYPPTPIF